MLKPKIIIDTDPGHDDALAIMLLAKSGNVDIEAITTVAGNSNIQNVTNNARYLVDLLDLKIPIYSGSDKPLVKDLVMANVHGKSGLDGVDVLKKEKLNNLAVAKIAEIVNKNPNQVSIVLIGAETNFAKCLIQNPDLANKVKELVIMGGAINVPGNKSRVAEFNIFVDPDAAKIVFDSPIPKILIPLDVCNEIVLFLSDFEKIKGKLRLPILSMMEKFIKGIEKFEMSKGALVYDALAAYYLINPGAYTLEDCDIRIETKGEFTSGMTVIDQTRWGEKNMNVKLVTKIDRNKFTEDFIKILSKK